LPELPSVTVTEEQYQQIANLVINGDYKSIAEFIREAIRANLKEYKGLKEFCLGSMSESEFREMHAKQKKFIAEHNGLTPAELIQMTEKEAQNSGFLDEWKKKQAKIAEDIKRIREMP